MTRRDRQAGNSMVLALIVMSSLAALGSLTALSVQGSLKSSSTDRFESIALYAAESGAAVAMDWLRTNLDNNPGPGHGWSAIVRPNNNNPVAPPFVSNGALPGDPNNTFSSDQHAWYEITILNNLGDAGYNPGTDEDWRVTIHAIGHGPQGSIAVVEWDVQATNWTPRLTLIGSHVVL